MPGGSEGGGTTQKTEPWGPAKGHLMNLYARARDRSQEPSLGLYSQGPGQRYTNLEALWGATPGALAGAYGLSPETMDLGVRTGVAALNDYDRDAIRRTNELSFSPISGLYGQAEAATSNLMNNGVGSWGHDAVRTSQGLAANGLGPMGAQAGNIYGKLGSQGLGTRGDEAAGVFSQTARQGLGADGRAASQTFRDLSANPMGAAGNAAERALMKTSSGAYLTPDSNPYLKGMYEAATRPAIEQFNTQILPGITSQFSSSGRYGSGAQERVATQSGEGLSRNLLDTASNLYGNAYGQERGLQEGATRSLADYGNAAAGIRTGAAQGLGNLAATDVNLRQAGAQGLYGVASGDAAVRNAAAGGLGQLGTADANVRQAASNSLGTLAGMDADIRGRAAQMAPGIAGATTDAQQQRIAMQGQLGGMLRGLNQNLLSAGGQNYQGIVDDPYNRINFYGNIMQGLPGGLGTTTQQQAGAGGGFNASGAVGGAMGGAMLGNMLFPGAGMIPGALLGGGMGAFF